MRRYQQDGSLNLIVTEDIMVIAPMARFDINTCFPSSTESSSLGEEPEDIKAKKGKQWIELG